MKSGRTPLTFSVIGMAAREAMLIKSFVRMLDSRTKQRWVYKAQQDDREQQAADLTFLGDEGELPDANAAATGPRQLRMGVLALDAYAKLDRPLRPDELERELNRMGKLLVMARMQSASTLNVAYNSATGGGDYASTSHDENAANAEPLYLWQLPEKGSTHSEFVLTSALSTEFAGTVPASLSVSTARAAAPAKPVSAVPRLVPALRRAPVPEKVVQQPVAAAVLADAAIAAAMVVAPTDKLRLLRWPHASLINTPPKLKLAAFMASGSNTLEILQRSSGQAMPVCVDFVQALHASGFLSIMPFTEVAADSLDLRGQSRAAPTSPASSLRQERVSAPSPAASSTGLFARIRARLGISQAG